MAESKAHMDFVRRMVAYVKSEIPGCDEIMINADLPEYYGRTPQVIGGFYPDLYHSNSKCIVIGEAKTDNDLENEHTRNQIECYIEEVRCFHKERHIVLCTSILSYALLKNWVIRKKREEELDDITFHVLDSYKKSSKI